MFSLLFKFTKTKIPFRFSIKFIVVAEPHENADEQLNCKDIGFATVNAKQILRTEKDCIDAEIDGKTNEARIDKSFVLSLLVHDMDDENEIIGSMNVTVSLMDALKKVQTTRRLQT